MLAYNYVDPGEIPEWFWEVIAKARGNADTFADQLQDVPTVDLYRIEAVYAGAANLLKDERFHLHRSDQSDDAIDDITDWAVGCGREHYMGVWDRRLLLPDYGSDVGLLFCGILSTYKSRFGEFPLDREAP